MPCLVSHAAFVGAYSLGHPKRSQSFYIVHCASSDLQLYEQRKTRFVDKLRRVV
jgi:hypothetical protein